MKPQWFSVIHAEAGAKADQLVEWRGYVDTDETGGSWRYWVRWPVGGRFVQAYIRKDNLLPELPPDAWLADAPR